MGRTCERRLGDLQKRAPPFRLPWLTMPLPVSDGFYLKDGTLCTRITNTVAIRPKGYIKATTPPAQADEL